MKVIHEGKHVKTIPAKFGVISGLGKRFSKSEKKRLSGIERFDLEVELWRMGLEQKYQELIAGLSPKKAQYVALKNGGGYYTVVFGAYRLRCPRVIYDLCPLQENTFALR